MYISPDRNHHSILPVKFGQERLLLIGGGGNLSGLRLSKEKKYQKLAAYAEENFGVSNFTHKWSDRDYVAYDKVPLIGKMYPWSKHLYVGTGFKKWGMTSGTVAGMILTDLIAGRENKYAAVFTPQRLRPILNIPRAIAEQIKQQIQS
jgi:glycine/D-amino acid oxidase-like deaminating enzyme